MAMAADDATRPRTPSGTWGNFGRLKILETRPCWAWL